jgi:hypothetical protein
MDLKTWYKKVRDAESTLTSEHIVIVSLATSEGGKAGVQTEVPRLIAARLIAEGRARVASDEEASDFREKIQAALEARKQEEAASRVQVVMIPAPDFRLDRAKKQEERS